MGIEGVLLYGWDSTNTKWVPLICNADGKLIIDPSEILEDTPTDNEVGKAPTSNWAYDHEHDPDAHHTPTPTASGNYTGDDTANRAIPHGLGSTPKIVFIWDNTTPSGFMRQQAGITATLYVTPAAVGAVTVTAMDATNFYVGNTAASYVPDNQLNHVYYWVAIG